MSGYEQTLHDRIALLERGVSSQLAANDQLQRELDHKSRCIDALTSTVRELQKAVLGRTPFIDRLCLSERTRA